MELDMDIIPIIPYHVQETTFSEMFGVNLMYNSLYTILFFDLIVIGFFIFRLVNIDIREVRNKCFGRIIGNRENNDNSHTRDTDNINCDLSHFDINNNDKNIIILNIKMRQYFSVEINRSKLLDMLTGITPITNGIIKSIIEDKTIEYPLERNNIVEMFNVHEEYNKQIKEYGECYFNYTSNIDSVYIGIRNNVTCHSSLRQLIFYHWFFENVYDSVKDIYPTTD